ATRGWCSPAGRARWWRTRGRPPMPPGWRSMRKPSSCDGIPSSCDGIPSSCDGIPSSCHGIPSSCDGIPSSCDGIPSSCDGIPSSCDMIPSSCDGIPSIGRLHRLNSRRWRVPLGWLTNDDACCPFLLVGLCCSDG
ncbi:unnamed protein product, partial [Ectocarpus sp. 8 AP-2014]